MKTFSFFILFLFFQSQAYANSSLDLFDIQNKILIDHLTVNLNTRSENKNIDSLKKKAIKKLEKNNEFFIYALVYNAFLANDPSGNILRLCQKTLKKILLDEEYISSFITLAQKNIIEYDLAIKLLLINFTELALDSDVENLLDFSILLKILSSDPDLDISNLSKSLLVKFNYIYKFTDFLKWAKLPEKEQKNINPHFSCSFYSRDKDRSSTDCYYELKSNFEKFLSQNKYTIIEVKDESQLRWTKTIYFAKPNSIRFKGFKFIYESEITRSGMQGYSKIYTISP